MTRSSYTRQIQNRNYLSAVGFKFSISRAPKISFFGNSINIPAVSMGNATQPTYLKDIPIPGDKMEFEDLSVRFLVDENLENYMKIHNWLRGLGYPETTKNYKDYMTDNVTNIYDPEQNSFSDGALHILNSNYRDVAIVKFDDLFPVYLTSLDFDASEGDINYFTADVTFKYTVYNIVAADGRTPL